MSLILASLAIKKASKLLKTSNDCQRFVSSLLCASMIDFKYHCDRLVTQVQLKCSKVRVGPIASFPGIKVVGCMPTHKINKIISDILAATWKSLRQTQLALANIKNREESIEKSSISKMDSFKGTAYKMLGVIEEGCPGVQARKKLR